MARIARQTFDNDYRLRGEKSPNSKLTEQQVRDIRRLHASGVWQMKELAQEFGVRNSTISNIIHRRTWKHI